MCLITQARPITANIETTISINLFTIITPICYWTLSFKNHIVDDILFLT